MEKKLTGRFSEKLANSSYGKSAIETGGIITGVSVGLLTLVAAFYIGKKFVGSTIEELKQGNANKSALKIGEAANYAARFRVAIEGWGMDAKTIFNILIEIPTQADVVKVDTAYKNLTGEYLSVTLSKEWTWYSSDSEKFQQIVKQKPLN